jgi:dipeptidyl aminopeptidase/acylaminoacyl peptidase
MPAALRRTLARLVALAVGATTAHAQTVTIEHLLDAPFPSSLATSPTGAVAWALDSVGARNVWIAEPPAYASRRLTSYLADDGQELTAVQWTPDGRVVYVRGGDPNARGEIPNPALLPQGTSQEVWIVARDGSAPRKLGDGAAPRVSPALTGPSAGRVAFVAKGQIWWASQDGGAAEQLTHTRGTASTLRWSPDGARLAFVDDRGDHGFVGVYDVAARSIRYLAPSVDTDHDPAWSPDGRSIAFARSPALTRIAVFGARRGGRPWSIWVADAATGAGRAIWTADSGAGSVFRGFDDPEEVGTDDLFWGRGDQLLFPWERDGWLELYRVAAHGGPAVQLTQGAFEIGQASLTPDRATVLLSDNQGDSERRHVWRLAVDARPGTATPVTTGDGIEWSPLAASQDGGVLAIFRSNARTPARPALVTPATPTTAPRDLETRPSTFPAAQLVLPEAVTFAAADGLSIHGQLFLPPTPPPAGGRRPAIVFFHGGSQRQMLLGFHYMAYYHNAYAMNQYLASLGYLVLAVNYRSGIGYGMPFREAEHYGATGASEYNDVLGAGRYLRGRADVDPARIGAWGGSYGGYLTALALARSSDLFAAGVDLHGVHDWNLEFEALVPGWDVARDQDARRLAFRSSPMADVATWRSPVLLIQGDDDRNVAFAQTVQLTEDLRNRGVHVETLVFPDEIHDFLRHADWLAAYHAAADFFGRTLGH